eukprot:scaffold69685_cov14-Tisochrysis_lutea.AAC.1
MLAQLLANRSNWSAAISACHELCQSAAAFLFGIICTQRRVHLALQRARDNSCPCEKRSWKEEGR